MYPTLSSRSPLWTCSILFPWSVRIFPAKPFPLRAPEKPGEISRGPVPRVQHHRGAKSSATWVQQARTSRIDKIVIHGRVPTIPGGIPSPKI